MILSRTLRKLATLAAVVVAVLPSLVQAFIPSVSDHIGTIRALVNATSGETVAEYEYDPYGVLLEEAGEQADACPFRFSSKYYDSETQLLYFGYRYYNAASTKWLTVDPLQERGGLNFTAYCGGDPVNQVDPLGLSFLSWLLGCGWNTEEARAFDDYLHEDYWGGDFSRRGIAAINAELKMAVGAVEALGGAKLTALSGGLAAAGGYALVADGSSWMSGGAGDYLNLFRDDDFPDYDVVGAGFTEMAGPTWGPVARSTVTMGLSMGTPVLAQQQMNAALTAEAQAIRLQSHLEKNTKFRYEGSAHQYRAMTTGRFISQKILPYPPNRGFASSTRQLLSKGQIVDRYGLPNGRFAGTPGSSVSARGMPPGSDALPYARYRVARPFEAEVGPAFGVPEFGASGGATQYRFDHAIEQLVRDKFLEVLP